MAGATIRLIPMTRPLLGLMDSPQSFETCCRLAATLEQLAQMRPILIQSFEFYEKVGAVTPWVGYLSAQERPAQLVGCCGFKGNPSPEGDVEIAYFTFPEFESRGFATGAALELVALARADGHVRRVLAHTLPARNASCRVLEKTGFHCLGEVMDPEDGKVWRWSMDLS